MSRFYGEIIGKAKLAATRCGGARSGIQGILRGWDVGIRVSGYVGEDGRDAFDVFLTSGSNEHHSAAHYRIGTATLSEEGLPVFTRG